MRRNISILQVEESVVQESVEHESGVKARNRQKNIRRRTSSLQESRLADLTLDILGLFIDLKLRLCDLSVFVLAVTLGCCLCALKRKRSAQFGGAEVG